jgi:hypothetical protein
LRGYVVTTYPNKKIRKIGDLIIISWLIKTVKFTSFNWLYNAFYPNGKKVIPYQIVEEYISPLTLAIWFMDEGSGLNKGVKLATQGFTCPYGAGKSFLRRRKVLPCLRQGKSWPL